jgi:enhancer of mRNA-decapping protein 4
MASPAKNTNPNPNQPFELGKLFRPPANPMPTATAATIFPGAAGGPAGPPPPSGPYAYPPVTPPFHRGPYLHYPQDPHAMPRPVVSFPMPSPNPGSNPNAAAPPGPNPGARLMQLLGNSGPTQLETAVSMPPPTSELTPQQPLPAMPSAPPARMLSSASSKVPRGRLLGGGERAVHDVDSRLPGEVHPPQLEVTPITKYTSDPGLVLGRQIAVNRTYIVYGLKLGNIRVLNINTALRSLLRGHTQV